MLILLVWKMNYTIDLSLNLRLLNLLLLSIDWSLPLFKPPSSPLAVVQCYVVLGLCAPDTPLVEKYTYIPQLRLKSMTGGTWSNYK